MKIEPLPITLIKMLNIYFLDKYVIRPMSILNWDLSCMGMF